MAQRSTSSSEPDFLGASQTELAARAALREPTAAEIAASASPTYVAYLSHLLDQRDPFDERLLSRLNELAAEREQRATQALHAQAHAEEVRALRQDVTEKTLQLQEERERTRRLQHENTVLYVQETAQRERVAALAALCRQRGLDETTATETGASRGRQPAVLSRSTAGTEVPMPKSFSLRAAATAHAQPRQRLPDGTPAADDVASGADENDGHATSRDAAVQRALALTSHETQASHVLALTEEVQMLRDQLDTQRSMYEHERGKRLVEQEAEHRRSVEQTRNLLRTIQHLEELHEVCLRDLVTYRHQSEKALRDCHGQIDWLKQHMQEALRFAERTTRRGVGAAAASEQRVLQRVNPVVVRLREEHSKLKTRLAQEQHTHAAQLSAQDQALQDAKAAVAQERTRRRREEERHRLEMEGVRSELDLMRHALRQMEKRVYFTGSRLDVAATEEQRLTDDYFY